MKTKHLLTLLPVVVSMTACATKHDVPFRPSPGAPFTAKKARYDYSAYAHIPDTPTSWLFRTVAKAIPYTHDRAFWGNYGGSGCCGGIPIDEMDEIFRRHDIAYAEARSLRTMQWADAACVEALGKLDTRKMSPEAIAFKNRAASFFANRSLTLIGKPVSSYFVQHEWKDCPFKSPFDVRELFGLEKSSPSTVKPQHNVASRKPTGMLVSAKPKAMRTILATSKTKPIKPAITQRQLFTSNPPPLTR